jgi:hypothetical protein
MVSSIKCTFFLQGSDPAMGRLERGMYTQLWTLTVLCFLITPGLAQEKSRKGDSSGGEDARPGPMVVLGTVHAEIIRVGDGGSKIAVRFKEIVQSNSRKNITGLRTGRVRLPTLREKTQDVDLRVYPNTTIRLVNVGSDGKGAEAAKESAMENEDADNKSKTDKKSSNSTREKKLPGAKGERKDLVKGQVVIVTIAEEQAAGFSRYVATSIYVLGEK